VETCFVDFVLGQLGGVERFGCRAMFGGYALYCGPTFFGIISRGGLYLKTDDATVCQYGGPGVEPFEPGGPETLRTFYRVPPDVLANRQRVTRWANAAVLYASGRRVAPSVPVVAASPAWAPPSTVA